MTKCFLCGKPIECPVCDLPAVIGVHTCGDCDKALDPLDKKLNDPYGLADSASDVHKCEYCGGGIDSAIKKSCDVLKADGKHPGSLFALACPHCQKMTRV